MIPYHTTRLSQNQVELDLTQLTLLSANDPGFKNQILGMLYDQAQIVVLDLESALGKSDWAAIAEIAHKFKSSVNIISQESYNQLKELEREARGEEDLNHVRMMTKRSIGLVTLLGSSIEKELAKSS